MAEKISLKSNIKVFEIENEDGSRVLAQLRLDPDNDATLGRFMDLYDNISKIGREVQAKYDALDRNSDKLTVDEARQLLDIDIESINAIITETDNMFGAGFTKQIFIEHYESDPDFVPNIALFNEFYNQIMPIVQSVYRESSKNYSVKKGK